MPYEEYVAQEKERFYKSAFSESYVDRMMSHILGTMFWPVALIPIIIYYICYFIVKIGRKLKLNDLGLNAAAQDVRKAKKKVNKAKEALALENSKIDEWNSMVDILNENGLNDITKYQKKDKVK